MDKKTILVVDDEEDSVSVLEAILKDQGFDVLAAGDGQEGLNKTRAELPDLVILDVQMPIVNGYDVFKILRDDEKTNAIPIIMLTGIKEKIGVSFSKEDMKEFYHEEPEDYLEKPIEPEKVIAAVKRILKT